MKPLLLTPILLLFATLAHAQTAAVPVKPCVFEFCNAVLPKTAGEKVTGKDNCGNYCSKHGIAIETPPTASPVAAKPETVIVPGKPAITAADFKVGNASTSGSTYFTVKSGSVYSTPTPLNLGPATPKTY